jgi:prepilin-type N-terminal cleavage/methylation domain-containing protein
MQPRRHGFTLLELLVAMTVTLMLTGLLLAVLSTTLGLWQRLRGGIDQTTQGRLALDWLERDLQGALHRADGNTWMAVDILNSPAALAGHGWLVQPMMKPGGADSLRMIPPGPTATIADARFGLSGCWVRWVSQNLEPVGTASAPVVVSYQLVRRPITGAIASSNKQMHIGMVPLSLCSHLGWGAQRRAKEGRGGAAQFASRAGRASARGQRRVW